MVLNPGGFMPELGESDLEGRLEFAKRLIDGVPMGLLMVDADLRVQFAMRDELVKARETAGQSQPTLSVVAIGDLDVIEKRLERLSRTA